MSEKMRVAARQALEALQLIYIAPEHEEYIRVWWPACREAITALRAALSEPDTRRWNIERDGEALLICDGQHENHESCEYRRYVLAKPETVQEPVAWMWEETAPRSSTGIGGIDRKLLFCRPADEPWKRNITPLYTAPPQREPLTDEEIDALALEVRCDPAALRSAIERKVRGEKE